MRVPKGWVSPLTKEIVAALCKKKLVELKIAQGKAVEVLHDVILNEFTIEDRLNKEVNELLKKYDVEIEKGRLDYRKLFELTKQKLVKERNIIL
ncbi:MAG: DUF507 family protein [Thermodesulfovibrionia bacterium]|nr:DUF507 family protein [Thermodesulfovibrionia bacterium]